MTIDTRIPPTPGRLRSGFHPPGRYCLHKALKHREICGQPLEGCASCSYVRTACDEGFKDLVCAYTLDDSVECRRGEGNDDERRAIVNIKKSEKLTRGDTVLSHLQLAPNLHVPVRRKVMQVSFPGWRGKAPPCPPPRVPAERGGTLPPDSPAG